MSTKCLTVLVSTFSVEKLHNYTNLLCDQLLLLLKSTCLLIGSDSYQELLVKALPKSFDAKLIIIDYSLLAGVSLLTTLLAPTNFQ
jgi:hypothetical protein